MSEYLNPCVTADIIIERREELLLIKRAIEPFRDMWAFPGGDLNYGDETVEETGVRELFEETGLRAKVSDLELIGVYSEPGRDPRGHYVTCAYVARNFRGEIMAKDDARDVRFFPMDNLPELAFDHEKILMDYITKFKGGVK